MNKKKKLKQKDKDLLGFFKKGGREGSKEDFERLLKKASLKKC